MKFVQSTHALDRNQLLFTVIGETTHESGYAHLVSWNLGSKRKRSVAATVGALFGLASFGSSIFNTAQLHRLKEDHQRIEENQQFLMEELVEHNLRINNITPFVEDQYKSWVKQVKLIQETQRGTVMVEIGQQIHDSRLSGWNSQISLLGSPG